MKTTLKSQPKTFTYNLAAFEYPNGTIAYEIRKVKNILQPKASVDDIFRKVGAEIVIDYLRRIGYDSAKKLPPSKIKIRSKSRKDQKILEAIIGIEQKKDNLPEVSTKEGKGQYRCLTLSEMAKITQTVRELLTANLRGKQ